MEWHLLRRVIDCVVHVHVPGLGRGINLVVEFVRPGSDDLLEIVVTELAVVEVIVAGVNRIHLVRGSPLDHRRAGYLPARIILPKSDIGSIRNAKLNRPLIVNFRGRKDSFLAVVIEAVEERVTCHEIVRRQLRFDVRLGNDSSDADVHALKNVRNVKIEINHRHVETGVTVVLQQLIAEKPEGGRESVVEPVEG